MSMMIRTRKLLKAIENHLDDKRHTIITGARQVGKTSLLRLLFRQLKDDGKKVFFLTLEDARILNGINEHPDKLFNFVAESPTPSIEATAGERLFILVDEVQYAEDPTNFLKFIYDKYEANVKMIVTGSSAFYIDRKFTDSLAGRKRIFNLFPLSFEEYLSFRDADSLLEEFNFLQKKSEYQSTSMSDLQNYFHEYLVFGGYPAVVLENDRTEKIFLLNELKNAYVKRDILESRIEKEGKFYLMIQLLADRIGSLFNKQDIGNTVQLDAKTVENYLYVLQKCYHIQLMRPFFRNTTKELTKMPKLYFNDLGLRNAFLNRFEQPDFRADKGELLENYFFLRLRESYSIDQIKFWRTADKKEVDFVIEKSFGKGSAFEIKWNKNAFKPKKYQKFIDAYPDFELSCLSADDFFKIL